MAQEVFRLSGRDPADVTATTEAYAAGAAGPVSPRPARSVLDLAKLEGTGFATRDWRVALEGYLRG